MSQIGVEHDCRNRKTIGSNSRNVSTVSINAGEPKQENRKEIKGDCFSFGDRIMICKDCKKEKPQKEMFRGRIKAYQYTRCIECVIKSRPKHTKEQLRRFGIK